MSSSVTVRKCWQGLRTTAIRLSVSRMITGSPNTAANASAQLFGLSIIRR